MEAITTTLLLLASVVVSSIVQRVVRVRLPLAIVQTGLGALLAQLFDFHVSLSPEVFLLLFVAPLLFLDGWHISKEGLLRDKWTIGALALGLVLFTVLGAGLFIHWLVPVMPLPIAFALASVLSPTDAVAVSAMAERTPLPRRLMHVLEGEALLNDASGLVCLRFAVAAALTGYFSPAEASRTFLWLAGGGVLAGAAVTLAANATKDWTARHFGEETGTQILISLLIPFGAYLLADRLAASGILAAATAGVVMSREELAGRALASTRIRRAAVWDAVQFAGNGVVFVLLGHQLPGIIAGAGRAIQPTGRQHALWLLAYVAAISAILYLLRALWAWASLRLILFRSARDGHGISAPGWRLIAVTTLAGVRGAVTLAGVMTLPLALRDGAGFPTRDLAIFLAAGVIVVTLLAANAGLPLLMSGISLPRGTLEQRQADAARSAAARAAILAVERAMQDAGNEASDLGLYAQAGARVLAQYREQIQARTDAGDASRPTRTPDEIERGLRILALRAERDELYRIARSGNLAEEATRALVREVDLQESRFSAH